MVIILIYDIDIAFPIICDINWISKLCVRRSSIRVPIITSTGNCTHHTIRRDLPNPFIPFICSINVPVLPHGKFHSTRNATTKHCITSHSICKTFNTTNQCTYHSIRRDLPYPLVSRICNIQVAVFIESHPFGIIKFGRSAHSIFESRNTTTAGKYTYHTTRCDFVDDFIIMIRDIQIVLRIYCNSGIRTIKIQQIGCFGNCAHHWICRFHNPRC